MSLLTLIQADTDTSSFSPELKADGDKDFRPSIDECEAIKNWVAFCPNIARLRRSGPLNIAPE